ncbi:hypothetical protein B0J11DRAFT_16637 [Dendryphion nanum]|uniref:Uncharacterized protein n=1 Tax=Dendryphion nanum TaxID=256645 RepID=A0A9P9EIJ1_9PLEO|nr:hypothetical protein B0J11DRAFT_16637 [Dendryphion nanum]
MTTDFASSLKSHFSGSDQKLRPILTSLNGDNSWLLSFPRPQLERENTGKVFFHAVHDPWLAGPTHFLSTWLVYISHTIVPSVKDGAGVERVAQEIEEAAAVAGINAGKKNSEIGASSMIDAIFIHFYGIDHLHGPTLLTFDPKIPVFVTPEGGKGIHDLNHFETVRITSDVKPDSKDWKTLHPGAPLPEWLTLFRMTGHHSLSFCTAMIWSPTPDVHEAIMYSPHGIRVAEPTVQTFLHKTAPDVKVLAILHALKESIAYGWLNSYGVSYGLPLYRESSAKYWVLSHDSQLTYQGIGMIGVKDVRRTLEWGLGREKEENKLGEDLKDVTFVEVSNGNCTVLM